jgi:MFS family permease
MVFFGLAIPLSARMADRFGPRPVLMVATAAMVLFGLLFAPLLGAGGQPSVLACLCLGLAFMGLGYGPLGAALAALFPTAVRYTGASMAFNLAGILGASLTPYVATWLATDHGLSAVGYYLSAAASVSLVALFLLSRNAMSQR